MKNRRLTRAVRTITFIILVSVTNFLSAALGDEQIIQADVYNSLYEAYVECDEEFGQSRSEFITAKLELGSGQITIASLKSILSSNIEDAKEAIFEKTAERELYVSEIIEGRNKSADQQEELSEDNRSPHSEVREIDAFVKEQRRLVEIHECVLETL